MRGGYDFFSRMSCPLPSFKSGDLGGAHTGISPQAKEPIEAHNPCDHISTGAVHLGAAGLDSWREKRLSLLRDRSSGRAMYDDVLPRESSCFGRTRCRLRDRRSVATLGARPYRAIKKKAPLAATPLPNSQKPTSRSCMPKGRETVGIILSPSRSARQVPRHRQPRSRYLARSEAASPSNSSWCASSPLASPNEGLIVRECFLARVERHLVPVLGQGDIMNHLGAARAPSAAGRLTSTRLAACSPRRSAKPRPLRLLLGRRERQDFTPPISFAVAASGATWALLTPHRMSCDPPTRAGSERSRGKDIDL